jgi:Domain of unknown function (DUF4389)
MDPTAPGEAPRLINFRSIQPVERDRLTAALRLIWVIPQAIVLTFVYIAAFFVAVVGWLGALVTGELPDFAEKFLSGALRWGVRVNGYFYFLTDAYPPFSLDEDLNYPIRISIPARAPLNRLAVLFRIFLVIPAAIVGSVVAAGLGIISVGSWAMITFTGRLPIPLYEAARAVIRFHLRLGGYFILLTSEYPWGLLGDLPTAGDEETPQRSEWSIWLSQGGRNAMIVVIVLGIIETIINRAWR